MQTTLTQALARLPLWDAAFTPDPIPLTGGITNRNYRLDVGADSYVLRLSGENTELLGIHRRTERAANAAAFALGLAPEVVYFLEPEGYLVTRFVEGAPLSAETLREPGWLKQVAQALARFHAHGPALDHAFDIFQVLADLTEVARQHHGRFPENFAWLMARVAEVQRAFARAPYTPRPCHNDLLSANFLDQQGRLIILDWEYAGMGDVTFDLANFACHHALDDAQLRFFLECYFGAATEKHLARVRLMEPLSDMREALWGVAQTGLSTLDEDFAGYARQWFERAGAAFQAPRLGEWLELA